MKCDLCSVKYTVQGLLRGIVPATVYGMHMVLVVE